MTLLPARQAQTREVLQVKTFIMGSCRRHAAHDNACVPKVPERSCTESTRVLVLAREGQTFHGVLSSHTREMQELPHIGQEVT